MYEISIWWCSITTNKHLIVFIYFNQQKKTVRKAFNRNHSYSIISVLVCSWIRKLIVAILVSFLSRFCFLCTVSSLLSSAFLWRVCMFAHQIPHSDNNNDAIVAAIAVQPSRQLRKRSHKKLEAVHDTVTSFIENAITLVLRTHSGRQSIGSLSRRISYLASTSAAHHHHHHQTINVIHRKCISFI